MKTYCFTLDLKDDPQLIEAYERHHQAVWPEVQRSIQDSGILAMDIYRWENRLFMIMKTEDDFTLEEKAKKDAENPKVQEWEALMWRFQQPLPGVAPGTKWVPLQNIFNFQAA
jgi:L-rhamnose mutarotase